MKILNEVTVLVAVLNKKETIEDCLKSLLKLTHQPARMMIVDGGSNDGTYEILKKYQDKIDLFQLFIGHSDRMNWALDQIKTEYAALTDADCTVEPDWLEKLLEGFSQEENIVATAGYCGTPKDISLLQKIIGLEMDDRFKNLPHYLYRAPTMNLCLKTEIAKKVRFDEKQKVAIETDFGFRLSRHGKIIYLPQAKVWHYHRTSLAGYFQQQKNQAKWGLRLIFKHRRRAISDPITPLRMTIQIPFFFMGLFFLLLSLLSQFFLYPSVFFLLILLLIYFKNILAINPPLSYYLIFCPFFFYRTIAWTVGIIEGLFLFSKNLLK